MSSSSLSSLSIDSNESLLTQLNDVYTAVDAKLNINDCPELVQNCHTLYDGVRRVCSYAKQYDYKDIEANGYWTFTKLVLKYGKLVIGTYKKGNETLVPVSEVLLAGLNLCEKLHHDANQQQTTELETSIARTQLFPPTPTDFIDLLQLFKSLEPQLDVVYGDYCAYWLCPSMRRAMQGFTTIMAIYASGSAKTLQDRFTACKILWDRSHRAHVVAHIAQNATIDFVKSLWGLTELSIVKNALPTLMLRSQPKVIKSVYIPRQKQWIISDKRAEVYRNNSEEDMSGNLTKMTDSKIRCKLLQNNTEGKELDSIVLHVHGGGFVSQSPESHEVYLRDWACNLSGVPILSVDYSLSPESPYPIALQEILDVYLWIISKDQMVEETLGYHPSRVVVCGDSAGGNLSAALCLVLNDIRKQIDKKIDDNFRVPIAAVCFYTPFMLRTIPSPSRILTSVDTLLPLGVLLSCLDAYAGSSNSTPNKGPNLIPKSYENSPLESDRRNLSNSSQLKLSPVSPSSGVSEGESEHDSNLLFDYASLHFMKPLDFDCEKLSSEEESEITCEENDCDFEDFVHITYDDVPPDEDILFEFPTDFSFKFQRQFCHTFRKIRETFVGSSVSSEPKPWYRNEIPILQNKLDDLNNATTNPFISSVVGPEFDFDDISLYLVALHYDACLDDSITMAKKWKGPVSLDVLDELSHGFLNFILLSYEGKCGSELCVKRIREALKI